MAGTWDYVMKRLIGKHPRHFTRWLLEDATFVRILDNELKAQQLFADALLYVRINRKPALLHIEFQTYDDDNMAQRLQDYNTLASRQYDHLPVYSVVIYLRKKGKIAISPHTRIFPDGRRINDFHFDVIKLWQIPAENFFDLNLTALLPLVTLTENGKLTEVVNMMIAQLLKEGDKDLLAIATLVGGLAFTKEHEREAFKRRFHMFQEIIRDSWVYQELEQEFRGLGLEEGLEKGREQGLMQGLEKGREQGLMQGLEKGREQGLVQGLRQMLTNIVAIHYPELAAFAKEQAERITDPDTLQQLTIQIITSKGLEEAKELLRQINTGEIKH